MKDLKNIIESLIFVSDGPLTLDQIKGVLPEVDPKQIRAAVDALIREYESRPRGFYLREIAGGIQFRTRPEYKEHVAALLRSTPPRLSKAALETLAIIAYKQPIIRADIEHIRGVDSGGVLRLLMERKLVRVLGRREIPGRPLIYATTKQFLEVFDLKNLKELPTPKEIEELGLTGGERVEELPETGPPEITIPATVTVVQSARTAPPDEGIDSGAARALSQNDAAAAERDSASYQRRPRHRVDCDPDSEADLPELDLKD
jgi:segregation and condensation protein B